LQAFKAWICHYWTKIWGVYVKIVAHRYHINQKFRVTLNYKVCKPMYCCFLHSHVHTLYFSRKGITISNLLHIPFQHAVIWVSKTSTTMCNVLWILIRSITLKSLSARLESASNHCRWSHVNGGLLPIPTYKKGRQNPHVPFGR
jgi:hypothetical protein